MNRETPRKLAEIEEHKTEYSLAQELPYWDFIEENEQRCVVLSDGSLVQGFKLTGIDIETKTEDEINRITVGLRSLLNCLGDGCELQLLVDANSDFKSIIDKHDTLKGDTALLSWIADARTARLNSELNHAVLQRINLYLFVYLRWNQQNNSAFSFFKPHNHFISSTKDQHNLRYKELSRTATGIVESLNAVAIKVEPISNANTISLIYRLLNPGRAFIAEYPTLSKAHREQEFTSEELKRDGNLSLSSPREQLVFSDIVQNTDHFFLDGHYHRVITLKTLPEHTHAAMAQRLTTLPFHFWLSIQIRVPEQSKELSALQTKRRMAHSMSIGQAGRASDLESEAKLQSTEEVLRDVINSGQKIFYFQMSVLLKNKSKDELEVQSKSVLSKFRELGGAEALAETVGGFKLFKTSLPAGNISSPRARRTKTDNLADFLPLYQPWTGAENPVCIFKNRSNGLVGYDPFDSSLPNYNTLVTGSSGSGKSFLNNCILLQYLTQKPLVYVIDIGGSYRKLCDFLNGQYIEMIPPSDIQESTVALNPFILANGAREPSPQKIKFLLSFLETIFDDPGSQEKLSKLDKSLLEEALNQTYQRLLPNTPSFSDFVETLNQTTGQYSSRLREFSKMLYPWTGSRPYGKRLDSKNSIELKADFVVFDLKGLSAYPDLQAVMILIVTDFILTQIETRRDRRKLILMDECWELLKSSGASQFMEYSVRTLRKTGSGITFITQGLEEIVQSPIGAAILNNTATKFILMQRGDLEPVRRILKLNDQEIGLISSLRQKKGMFSEAFLMANENRSVIRVCPTPIEYWLATSDAQDNQIIEETKLTQSQLSLPEVIHKLSVTHPFGSSYYK